MYALTLETGGVGAVPANLAINLDKAWVNNTSDFAAIQSIFQSVAEEGVKGKRSVELMWAWQRMQSLRKINIKMN